MLKVPEFYWKIETEQNLMVVADITVLSSGIKKNNSYLLNAVLATQYCSVNVNLNPNTVKLNTGLLD